MDSFIYTVEAIDGDTFAFSLTVTDAGSGPAFTGFVYLLISDIVWLGMTGTIVGVIDNIIDGGGGSTHSLSFTNDSLFLSFFQGDTCSPSNCTFNLDLGTVDLVVDHVAVMAVPEPYTMALLGVGLVGIGITRRRKKA